MVMGRSESASTRPLKRGKGTPSMETGRSSTSSKDSISVWNSPRVWNACALLGRRGLRGMAAFTGGHRAGRPAPWRDRPPRRQSGCGGLDACLSDGDGHLPVALVPLVDEEGSGDVRAPGFVPGARVGQVGVQPGAHAVGVLGPLLQGAERALDDG